MKRTRKLFVTLLGVLFAFGLVLTTENTAVQAKAKTKLSKKSLTIAVASSGYKVGLKNKNSKATYTYSTSNKKVVTVSKKGAITALKAGTAKITVKQKLKKKKTKIGTMKVTVKNATVVKFSKDEEMWVTGQRGYWKYSGDTYNYLPCCDSLDYYLKYQNQKATYTYYSTNTSVLNITKAGRIKETQGTGRVKVQVKETYKKKTRSVGYLYVNVKEPEIIQDAITVVKGQLFYPVDDYTQALCRYFVEINDSPTPSEDLEFTESEDEDDEIVFEERDGEWTGGVQITKEGTYYVHLWPYDYAAGQYDKSYYLGYIAVTVEAHDTASDIQMDFEAYPEDYDEDEYNDTDGLNIRLTSDYSLDFYTTPYNYTGDYTVTVSDPDVLSCKLERAYDFYYGEDSASGRLFLSAKKEGTTTVTLSANGASTSFKVTVNKRTLETYDDYLSTRYYFDEALASDDSPEGKITITSSDESIATMSLDGIEESNDGIRYTAVYYWIETYGKSGEVTFTISYDGKVIDTLTYVVADDDEDDDDDDY